MPRVRKVVKLLKALAPLHLSIDVPDQSATSLQMEEKQIMDLMSPNQSDEVLHHDIGILIIHVPRLSQSLLLFPTTQPDPIDPSLSVQTHILRINRTVDRVTIFNCRSAGNQVYITYNM